MLDALGRDFARGQKIFICLIWILVAVLVLVAGAGAYFAWENHKLKKSQNLSQVNYPLLEKRISYFYEEMAAKRFENVWEMMAGVGRFKEDNPKEEYVNGLNSFFSGTDISYGKEGPLGIKNAIILVDRDRAITRLDIKFSDRQSSKGLTICEEIYWIWQRDNWYPARVFTCGDKEVQ